MSVEAYRVRFFHTIKMVLDGNISIYSYESDKEKISDAILKPQYIPDNYRLNEEKITDTTSVLEYGNDKKHLIFQQTIVTNEKMIFDTNYNSVEQIRINGMTVFLYRYTDETFWAYGEYGNSVYVLAGDTIQKEEIEKMNRYGKIYTILLIATAVSAVPLFMLLGGWALIPWGIIWGISMYFAFMLEKIKKDNDVQTYKEIVAFSEGQLLDDIQKQREIGKRPYQKILLVIGSGLITFAVCVLIGFLMHVFLN